ncbi:MAG TPA: dihydropteroate synthase [Orrella sp.]
MAMIWQCGRFEFDLERPILMGIVNVTPDSFSDGGRHASTQAAVDHARSLIQEGAQILDIGGESTRPGADPVSVSEELDRVLPVLEALGSDNVALSVDTCKPEVMQHALDAGADIINDVTGFRRPAAVDVVASHDRCGVCTMHMQGEPRTMQQAPTYDDVVQDVATALLASAKRLQDAGISVHRIALDVGFGFGKTVEHNYTLLRQIGSFVELGYPIVVGVSRKSMIGTVTGRPVGERVTGSVAAALIAVTLGARILRVHDVQATRDAMTVWETVTYGPEEKK